MATTATQQLSPVYDQANQQIAGLIPGAESIYQTLMSALGGTAQAQAQNVAQSAQTRGVFSQEAQNQMAGSLVGAAEQQQAQLGVNQAQDIAQLRQAQGQLGVGRVNAIQSLSDTLLQRELDAKQNKLAMTKLNRNYSLELQNAQRDLELARINAASSGGGGGGGGSSRLTPSQALEVINQNWAPGSDGYVNPAQWNELRSAYIKAGYSSSTFDRAFSNLVNPAHLKKSYNLPRYNGIKIQKDK